MRRIAIALAIAGATYGAAAGIGLILYQTGNIATGATHNDCTGIRAQLAEEQGIPEEDVAQSDVSAATQECLDEHERTAEEALHDVVFWSLWPATISAVAFLLWPFWARILHNQELADPVEEAPRLEMGE